MNETAPGLPKGAPRWIRRLYLWLAIVAAILGLLAYIAHQIPPIKSAVYDLCREVRVCGPSVLREMQPLASGFEPGNTVARAAKNQFEQYGRENPDWDICIKDTKSLPTHDAFNSNYRYRMEGTFFGVPKWRGLIDTVGDFLTGRTYVRPACPKG